MSILIFFHIKGDAGGPLNCPIYNKDSDIPNYELCGIVSWGAQKCGLKEYPSIYTRVSKYLDWIEKNMIEWQACPHSTTLIGNGKCDDHLNNPNCNFDGGDCCLPPLIGNNKCDPLNNFESCGDYDGGDCADTSYKNINWPNCPYNEDYIGNGKCDQYMGKVECNYDGLDCFDI